MPQAQVCVAVKFPFWKHICSTSYVSAILVSKRISNKRTFQEELHQLWLVGTCRWTQLGPYERCKMSCNIILLSLNAVGNKHDQTALCSQAMVSETHLCLIFRFGETVILAWIPRNFDRHGAGGGYHSFLCWISKQDNFFPFPLSS